MSESYKLRKRYIPPKKKPRSIKALINPVILKWARTYVKLTIDEVCKKIKISREILLKAEKESEVITIAKLEELANLYKFPSTIFYYEDIPEVPEDADFRSLSEKIDAYVQPYLLAELRRAHTIGEIAFDLVNFSNFSSREELVGKFADVKKLESTGYKTIVEWIRAKLNMATISLKGKSNREVFNYWRDTIENLGIIIYQFTSRFIKTTVTRGFSVSNKHLPVIAVNQGDAPYAKVFTLFHELAHILLNIPGICASSKDELTNPIEIICNRIAAESLVTYDQLIEKIPASKDINSLSVLSSIINELSSYFKVSKLVILYRLANEKMITDPLKREMRLILVKHRKPSSRGGNPLYNAKASLSPKYYEMNINAFNLDVINEFEVMSNLNISSKVFDYIQDME
ncbi:MAG: ImmA/IrrE family metallo-endopeptidase [Candidatus Kariarchaeaceae archaeon]|jgi:Zn-dependent peptidase ImmA (M78 family)/transcriptional regulator with XRE-family HTH domain